MAEGHMFFISLNMFSRTDNMTYGVCNMLNGRRTHSMATEHVLCAIEQLSYANDHAVCGMTHGVCLTKSEVGCWGKEHDLCQYDMFSGDIASSAETKVHNGYNTHMLCGDGTHFLVDPLPLAPLNAENYRSVRPLVMSCKYSKSQPTYHVSSCLVNF